MENELYHYGVMGMKWGVRKYQNEDGSLTAAGRRRYLTDSGKAAVERLGIRTGGSSSSDSKDQSFYRKHEKAIKVGLAVAGTALAAYGGYKLASSSTVRRFAAKGMKRLNKVDIPASGGLNVKSLLKANKGDVDFDLDKLPKLSKSISAEELINGVNPKRNISVHDKNFSEIFNGSHMNCFNCSMALEMRKRGYDVTASLNKNGVISENVGRYFKGLHSNSINSFKYDEVNLFGDLSSALKDYDKLTERGLKVQKALSNDILKSYPDGARGTMGVPIFQGRHAISWEIKDNKVTFLNPQDPEMNLISECFALFDQSTTGGQRYGAYATRLDDLELNLPELFTDMVESSDDYVKKMLRKKKIKPGEHDVFTLKGEGFVMQLA